MEEYNEKNNKNEQEAAENAEKKNPPKKKSKNGRKPVAYRFSAVITLRSRSKTLGSVSPATPTGPSRSTMGRENSCGEGRSERAARPRQRREILIVPRAPYAAGTCGKHPPAQSRRCFAAAAGRNLITEPLRLRQR